MKWSQHLFHGREEDGSGNHRSMKYQSEVLFRGDGKSKVKKLRTVLKGPGKRPQAKGYPGLNVFQLQGSTAYKVPHIGHIPASPYRYRERCRHRNIHSTIISIIPKLGLGVTICKADTEDMWRSCVMPKHMLALVHRMPIYPRNATATSSSIGRTQRLKMPLDDTRKLSKLGDFCLEERDFGLEAGR